MKADEIEKAKRRANELVDRFAEASDDTLESGIACALICIDEMIGANPPNMYFYEAVKAELLRN